MAPAGRISFGDFLKTRRIATGRTLREFCREHDLDPGNMSRMERGLLPPPRDRGKLEAYAGYLGLKKGSTEWFDFFDLAAAQAGTLPEDLKEEAVLKRLPVLFRTLRGKKVSEDQLDRLVDRLRRE